MGSVNGDRPHLGPCLEWTAALCHKGYGSFNLAKDLTKRAHVLAWKSVYGDVPEGLELSHLCDNRKCVNVNHLVAESHKENLARRKFPEECPKGHRDWVFRKSGSRECRECCKQRRKKYPSYYNPEKRRQRYLERGE